MADFLTFANIYDAVCNAIGDQGTSGSQSRLNEVKAAINMVYLNEVLNCDELFPLHWLMDTIDDVKTKTAKTITGITQASPGAITATAHGFVSGDIVQLSSISGMTELNNRHFVVVKIGADSFSLTDLTGTAINTTSLTAYTSGGTAQHRGVTLSKSFDIIRSFAWHGYSGQVEPIDMVTLEKSSNWQDPSSNGRPTRHMHKQHYTAAGVKYDRLLWFTLPDATSYQARIWGKLAVSPLSVSTDVPQLPFEFHPAIIAGTVARMVTYGQVQIENAVIWPGLYKMHIEAIKAYNRRYWKQFEKDQRSGAYLL